MSGLLVLSAIFVLSLVQGSPLVNEPVLRATGDKPTFPRLPLGVKPVQYEIKLTVDMEKNFTFEGKSSITLKVEKPTKEITLHAKNLVINSVTLGNLPTEPKELKGTVSKIDEKTDFVTIKFEKEIPISGNNYFLRLEYSGKVNDNKSGLYRSSYINNLGEKEWWAATQFEPIGARQVFPCFDEPAIKTSFVLTITCDKKYTVLSNTHETRSSISTDLMLKTTQFGFTSEMSTYLLAFAIGKFDIKRSENLTNLQVVTLRDRVEYGSYALNYSEKVLQALETWTGVPYVNEKMKKLDSVALPGMAEGGMENWGLITYQEDGLLARENYTSTAAKESIVKLVAHEIAHQWFGNLVTCEWWDYAWLNEGFATYFQYIITDMVEPTWNVMHKMVVDSIQAVAFVSDSKTTSHAMNMGLNSSEEVRPGFDSITYHKAGAIIRMIDHVLSKDQFQKAIKSYLSANEFKAVKPNVLFDELQKVTSDKKFKETLEQWVTTPGYPVVNVVRNYTTNKATISQSRFLYKKDDLEKTYYPVPINYVSEDKLNFDDTKAMRWLTASNKPLVIEDLPKDKFVLFNKQQFGYYRVNYDNETWKLITNFMIKNSSKIHVLNRAQLIDDSFNLARAGQLDYSVPLSLAKYLKEETDYIPWISAMNAASYLDRVLTNSTSSREFKNFVVELMDKMVKSVGFEEKADDDHVTLDKRATAVRWACAFGSKSCLDYAKEKFDKWMADPKKNPLSADLRETILCSGLHKASEITWSEIFKKYYEEQYKDLLPVLGCSSNENVIRFYLKIAMNSSFSIDINQALKSVYSNSNEGMKIALEVLIANYSQIVTLTGGDKNAVGNHISAIASRMTTEAELTPLKEFIKKNEKDLAVEIIAKGVAVAEDNINWMKTHDEQFVKLFKKETPQTSTTAPTTMKPGSAAAFTVSTLAILTSLIISLL